MVIGNKLLILLKGCYEYLKIECSNAQDDDVGEEEEVKGIHHESFKRPYQDLEEEHGEREQGQQHDVDWVRQEVDKGVWDDTKEEADTHIESQFGTEWGPESIKNGLHLQA